jgi:hypothetical protein
MDRHTEEENLKEEAVYRAHALLEQLIAARADLDKCVRPVRIALQLYNTPDGSAQIAFDLPASSRAPIFGAVHLGLLQGHQKHIEEIEAKLRDLGVTP